MKLYPIVKSCDITRIMENITNSFSTGGGGSRFESHIQASFVVLMLTGGYAPCFPCWPITKIKLQNKIRGYKTDDILVIVEDANSKKQQRLIGQIKYSINITEGDAMFGRVIKDAWKDFNNAEVFKKGEDIIALITGPFSQPDVHNVQWLLNQARSTEDADELFTRVNRAYFSSRDKQKKFDAIRHHLNVANGNNDVSNNELHEFLKHFYILGYDLGTECGVVLPLLHSHMSQFQLHSPESVWSQIVYIVQEKNKNAGTITRENLPEDLLKAFEKKVVEVEEMPEEFKAAQKRTDWMQHPDATYLALAILIGAWQDESQNDLDAIAKLLGISYDEWLKKAQEILHYPDSPLSLKNGVWKVVNRTELWDQLGVRILDKNIDTFKLLALSVLKEPDPAFEMPAEERYMASIHGKVMKYSRVLRQGIAEGLAILGAQPNACSNCSQGEVEATCGRVIHNLLTDADHVLWGSLNGLLPTLAEVDLDEFLDGVEKAMRMTPCPFNELFSQEGNGITGGNYLTGLLWALEGIAWDEKQLVRVCVVLGELASHDPGGQWENRPSNSLAAILMPWLPQTLASVDKRNVAAKTMFNEYPDVAWNLLLQLLPSQNQISSRTHKPIWRKSIPHDWKEGVTTGEYQQQISFYVEFAVDKAGQNADRLSKLIGYFDNLPEPDLSKILRSLTSQPILDLPEEQRLSIWEHLTRFTKRHRRFSYTEWALPNDIITRIEQVAEQIVPRNPFNLYQYLFSARNSDLYEDNKNWQEQEEKINTKRENAISEIFQQSGVKGVIQFAETVPSPNHVGQALIVITDAVIERTLLPHFLDTPNDKHKVLVSSFIWSKHFKKGWEWSDSIDKSVWTSAQTGQFFAYLPFTNKAWERASEWLQGEESEYWTRAKVDAYYVDGDIAIAIDKLIENDRPHAAINCLYRMFHSEQTIDTNQCIRVLRASLLSREPSYARDEYYTTELIKFLQTNPSVNQDDLCEVEWGYFSLLDYYEGVTPRTLERKLANDPKYFCEAIQLIYRSAKEESPYKELTEEAGAIATNALQLLHGWKIPPGTQEDGTFSEESFIEWIQNVKVACIESGHLKDALADIGKVLIHAPPDPKGLWIHHAVAKELDDRENDDMRESFRNGKYNLRGFHFVDPTGKPERELAEKFRNEADEVENAGFSRFASTLRNLAKGYDQEAERIINDSKNRNDK